MLCYAMLCYATHLEAAGGNSSASLVRGPAWPVQRPRDVRLRQNATLLLAAYRGPFAWLAALRTFPLDVVVHQKTARRSLHALSHAFCAHLLFTPSVHTATTPSGACCGPPPRLWR